MSRATNYSLIAGFMLSVYVSSAQQLPFFHQKLTDDFLFNPAYTGLSGGSISASYRRLWSDVEEAPTAYYATGHTLFSKRPIGVGGSFYTENQDLFRNVRAAISSSYQFKVSEEYRLSFGLSYEVFQSDLDRSKIFVRDADDPLLNVDNQLQMDITSGVVLSHALFDAGISYGRMMTAWSGGEDEVLSDFVVASANGYFKVRYGYDKVEPRLLYQINPVGDNILNASVFYTYADKYILGATYRTGSIGALSLGLRWDNRYLLAYSVEQRLDEAGRDLGFAHELTLRFDLNKQYFRRLNPNQKENLNSSTYQKKSK